MNDRNLNDLCPELRAIAIQWLAECTAAGLIVKIIVTWRSSADQDAAHAQGLSNAAAGDSPHNCCDDMGAPASRAFDFGIFTSGGVYVADGTDARYHEAAGIAKNLGLVWGGDWLHPDWDHLEMADWRDQNS